MVYPSRIQVSFETPLISQHLTMSARQRPYYGWLPASRAVHDEYMKCLRGRVTDRKSRRAAIQHEPAVESFRKAIEANPTMVELWRNVFLQVSKENQVPDFNTLLDLLDIIIVGPPEFAVSGNEGEPIGVPIYLLMDLLSNTGAAYDLFRMEEFNKAMKELLNDWGDYLKTIDSSRTLTDESNGWFSQLSIEQLEAGRGIFNETYVVFDETAVDRGYVSWDEFFTRRIQPSARPIIPPAEGQLVIYNACESTVDRIAEKVQLHDQFWLKGMAYSLHDIFATEDDAFATQFINGTVYQAFLSPQDYHRWHSPVKGTIVDARIVDGSYYAVLPDDGQDGTIDSGDPHGAIIRSQPWLTVAAARAIIIIQADSTEIGLVAFIGIGMVEVSSCELLVRKDQPVDPGQQIGMFHFGGSSHAVIFQEKAKLKFTDEVVQGQHIHVNRVIAGVNQ